MGSHEWIRHLVEEFASHEQDIRMGGGADRQAAEHAKGKLTARERIGLLIDPGTAFHEIGLWAAHGMYEEEGGCPSAGVITGVATVCGRQCMIVANDATVKAGAWFPMTAKKNLRAQEIALENRLPLIYLVDSAGVYLPLQDEVFADKEHFGRIFRNNAVISARGIPQFSAIMGSCVAGGAYLPIMSDEALIVEGTGSVFLAGSYLVKAAIGEEVDNETLGGAETHTAISGVVDHKVKDDREALQRIRELIAAMGPFPAAGFTRDEPKAPSASASEGRWLEAFPEDRSQPYDTYRLLDGLVDEGSFVEYKKDYGKTLITGVARIDGWSVGIIANQRKVVRSAAGEMQIGGVIYSDSADKAARFIMSCNQKRIPLLFLQDVTGFMIGTRSEHGGIIKDGAKMVNAVANSVVPKLTVIIGNSYGAGNYAMCGKAYDPRFIFAWPSARIAVMGGAQASKVLTQIQTANLKKKGIRLDEEQARDLERQTRERYEAQTDVRYAAARLWVDAIIDPEHTRQSISMALQCADHNPDIPAFSTGVMQV